MELTVVAALVATALFAAMAAFQATLGSGRAARGAETSVSFDSAPRLRRSLSLGRPT